VIGEENVPKDRAVLYAGNHRSFFDIILTYSRVPAPTGFLAKKEVFQVPLLNIWMKNIHCLSLDRKNIKEGLKAILAAIADVKSGISIFVFPEGTRNKTEDILLPFHDGSFKIADKGGCPVVPVTINNSRNVFENHFPWIKKAHVIIEYGVPLETAGLTKEQKKEIPNMVADVIKQTYQKNLSLI
jgi:1-acyl-sn-glycerol-3-phosphate acyltransferase